MNSLDLHLKGEVVLPYELYDGKVQEKLLQLLSEQRYPMGASDFTQRLEKISLYPEVLEGWSNSCPTLGDVIASHPYGSIRVIKGNPKLWNTIAKSRLRDGVIELRGNSYDSLGGAHISGRQMLRYRKDKDELRNVFSYLRISPEGRELCLPKVRDYPYLTMLAFNNSAKVLGASRLDDSSCLIGVK